MGKKTYETTDDALTNSNESSNSMQETPVKVPKVIFGKDGKDGKEGKDGKNGKDGKDGRRGKRGKDGKNGRDGSDGQDGKDGKDGKDGEPGQPGQQGEPGQPGQNGKDAVNTYANFYGLQPTNNLPVVLPGMAIEFPNDGPLYGDISRLSASTFNLATPGNYLVMFNLTVVEGAEVCVSLNSVELPQTLVARAAAETQLSGNYIINVPDPNTVLSIVNPVGTPIPLTLSSNNGTGSGKALSNHLNLLRL